MSLNKAINLNSKQLMTGLLSLSVLIVLGACSQKSLDINADNTVSDGSTSSLEKPSTSILPTETIAQTSAQIVTVTEAGFGNAKLCQTPEELQQALPDLVVGSRKEDEALIDTESVKVTDADGNLEFHAFFSHGMFSRGKKLDSFMTDNPKYKTIAGVGPGTSIEMAVSHYGPASLSYHTEVEGREYVSFENGPKGISFRTGTGPEAGIYSPTQSSYHQTKEYKPDAKIRWIWSSDRTGCNDSK